MHISARHILTASGHYAASRPSLPTDYSLKRLIDVAASFVLLIMLCPLLLLIGAVLHFSGQNVLYSQRRVGKGGKHFRCYKFCTMVANAEEKLQFLLQNDPAIAAEWRLHSKITNDPRVTSLGRFLRKTSLDELPQFWNVLIGDMSLVGPRPIPQNELVEHYGNKASVYKSLRPGITGLPQVTGRCHLSFPERVRLNVYYAQHRSFWMDLVILLKTVKVVMLSSTAR